MCLFGQGGLIMFDLSSTIPTYSTQNIIAIVVLGVIGGLFVGLFNFRLLLSMHLYGCRVIQRVLEHCDDENTQSLMMEEIMKSMVTLTEDQYDNYVIQNMNGDGPNIDISGLHMKTHAGSFASSKLNIDGEYGSLFSNQGGSSFQGQPTKTMYAQYLQANSDSPLGATGSVSPFHWRSFAGSGHLEISDTKRHILDQLPSKSYSMGCHTLESLVLLIQISTAMILHFAWE